MNLAETPPSARRKWRLALLVSANALAVSWLAYLLLPGASTAGGAHAAEPAPSAVAALAPTSARGAPPNASGFSVAPPTRLRGTFAPLPRALLDTLDRRVHAIVASAREKASAAAHGKFAADDVRVSAFVLPIGSDAGDGFGIDEDGAHMPASNMKLVTTAAALALLGPDWNFETRAEAAGRVASGVLDGDLVLRAGGDPLFDRGADGRVGHLLAPFCAELLAAGVREIRGDVVLDEGSFAAPAPGPAWPSPNEYWQEHCALAAGFTVNRGCVTVTVTPGAVGAPARVSVEPRGLDVPVKADVDTVARGAVEVHFEVRNGVLSVRGKVPARSEPWTGSCTHPDPVALFGAVLLHEFGEHGIRVAGSVRRERGARGGPTVARIVSPLARTLPAINTDSNNACADQLFLATALAVRGEATRAAGAQVTELALRQLGVDTAGFAQVDGSGLSRDDRISSRQLATLIAAVASRDPRAAELFESSLAVAGESGTLDGRFGNSTARGRVRAKTGFIHGVSALSGLANGGDGRGWVFSILVEYPHVDGLNNKVWKPMQNEICELLVGAGS
jgi:D-alanyl-D-alanine carboxypeptidase/D-alanyl-D-alanine-endopeptidase (penicillin-binding protein 4)